MSALYVPIELALPGHPDKICDQIGDSILDYMLKNDRNARVALEVMLKNNDLIVAGEVTSTYDLQEADVYHIAKKLFSSLRLPDEFLVKMLVNNQSPQISGVVGSGLAGDQASVVGYAYTETKNLLPPLLNLGREARAVILNIIDNYSSLRYDGKIMVARTNGVNKILVSVQHTDEIQGDFVRELVADKLTETLGECIIYVNPGCDFIYGGSFADAGVLGRKIVVDAYGAGVPVGGGAFSGKDLTKVDRSGAYVARALAKTVANMLDFRAEVFINATYGFGMSELIDLRCTIFDNEQNRFVIKHDINQYVQDVGPKFFDPRNFLSLLSGYGDSWLFADLAQRGHFGYSQLLWEKVPFDLVEN